MGLLRLSDTSLVEQPRAERDRVRGGAELGRCDIEQLPSCRGDAVREIGRDPQSTQLNRKLAQRTRCKHEPDRDPEYRREQDAKLRSCCERCCSLECGGRVTPTCDCKRVQLG